MTGQPSWYPWAESESDDAEEVSSLHQGEDASPSAADHADESEGEYVAPDANEDDDYYEEDVDEFLDTDSVASGSGDDRDELEDEREATEPDLREAEDVEEHWVTISQAAQALGLSETTIRRKVKAGEIDGELVFDNTIGSKRWMVDVTEFDVAKPDDTATLVPMAAIDRLEKAWSDTRDAVARAETAERIANFERERRLEAEDERDRLRSLLAAENDLAQRIAELEKSRRVQAEKERDRLRALLEVEPKRSWWAEMRERFRL